MPSPSLPTNAVIVASDDVIKFYSRVRLSEDGVLWRFKKVYATAFLRFLSSPQSLSLSLPRSFVFRRPPDFFPWLGLPSGYHKITKFAIQQDPSILTHQFY